MKKAARRMFSFGRGLIETFPFPIECDANCTQCEHTSHHTNQPTNTPHCAVSCVRACSKRKSKSKKKKQGVIVDDAVPTTTLLSLPDTILIAIIHLAGPIAASRLGACCRDLHTIATHDHLWRLLWKDRANSVLARKAAREAEQESERHPDRRPRPALCTVAPWIETPIPK
eukprot:m.261873 g.261873  ORF g.261873 m.261873 type:complete len:171 (-) comp26673_c0_seq16:5981-6493(-)